MRKPAPNGLRRCGAKAITPAIEAQAIELPRDAGDRAIEAAARGGLVPFFETAEQDSKFNEWE